MVVPLERSLEKKLREARLLKYGRPALLLSTTENHSDNASPQTHNLSAGHAVATTTDTIIALTEAKTAQKMGRQH